MPSRKKHKTFVDEPIQDKALTAVPGIGPALAKKLKGAQISDAKALLGGYLPVEGDDTRFFEWMRDKCKANRRQSDECFACLKEWSERNIPKMHDIAYQQVTVIHCLQGKLGERLSDAGYRYAKDIFGMYLQLGEDQESFSDWLTGEHAASSLQARQCFDFLQEMSRQQFRERNPKIASQVRGQTTQKHRAFVNEPIGEKSVTELPGVGPALGQKMAKQGIDKARLVLRAYFRFNEDRTEFTSWMSESFGASTKQAAMCFEGLREYAEQHL